MHCKSLWPALGFLIFALDHAQEAAHPELQIPSPEEVFSVDQLLTQSYFAGENLVPAERVFHLVALASASAELHHPATAAWANEALAVAAKLPASWNQLAVQKNALVALSRADATGALDQLAMLGPPVPLPDGSLPEDVRAHGARTIFMRYWQKHETTGLVRLTTVAAQLGETGQYPYLAMGTIMKELDKRDPVEAQAMFRVALSYYSKGSSRILAADQEFVASLGLVQDFPKPLLLEAYKILVGRLLERAETKDERRQTFRSRAYTDQGATEFRSREDQLLFQVLPIIRTMDPVWAKQLAERRRFNGAVRETQRVELAMIQNPENKNVSQARIGELSQKMFERTRLQKIKDLAGSDPDQALQLAATLTDPALHLAALAAAAAGYQDRDPPLAARLLRQSNDGLRDLQDKQAKLTALVAVAKASASEKNVTILEDTLVRAFDLGQELFQEDVDAHPEKPAYDVTGYDELIDLVRVGMQSATRTTVSRVVNLPNGILRSYLLITAAEGLGAVERAKPAAPRTPPI